MSIRYNLKTNMEINGYATMYYCDAKTYNSVSTLTASNATGAFVMQKADDGTYVVDLKGISPFNMDDTIYTSVVFKSGNASYCFGVLSYSYSEFCKVHAESKTSDLRPLAQAAIVYGYYLEKYLSE